MLDLMAMLPEVPVDGGGKTYMDSCVAYIHSFLPCSPALVEAGPPGTSFPLLW